MVTQFRSGRRRIIPGDPQRVRKLPWRYRVVADARSATTRSGYPTAWKYQFCQLLP